MKTNPKTGVTLRVVRRIRAPRAAVFAAWTTPSEIMQWLVPRPGRALSAEVDLRPGGRYLFHVSIPGGGEEDLHGTFQEVVPPERLVYTWAHRDNPDPQMNFGEALITVEFLDREGDTEIRLTQSRLPNVTLRELFRGGWDTALDQLEQTLA